MKLSFHSIWLDPFEKHYWILLTIILFSLATSSLLSASKASNIHEVPPFTRRHSLIFRPPLPIISIHPLAWESQIK